VSERISSYSELDALRRKGRARERITVSQLQAVQVARQSRSDAFGIDLANPGWSLLLELFRCYLEKRPVRLARLTENARVATTTALRWLDVLAERGLVERQPDPARQGASLLALTEAASDAMEDYFIAVQLAWDGLHCGGSKAPTESHTPWNYSPHFADKAGWTRPKRTK